MPDIKETLIDLLTGYSLDTYEDVQYVADELIANGVLPVVRCKDCKWYGKNENNWEDEDEMFCKYWTDWLPTYPDDFCSYGERKEAEKDG